MMRRVIRLLEPLTSRQRAQRKYQKSAKGRAAAARYREKVGKTEKYRAAGRARAAASWRANPVQKRVYQRVYLRRWRREKREAAIRAAA